MVLNRAADRSCARLIVGAGIVYSEDRKNKSVSGILTPSRFPEKYVMYDANTSRKGSLCGTRHPSHFLTEGYGATPHLSGTVVRLIFASLFLESTDRATGNSCREFCRGFACRDNRFQDFISWQMDQYGDQQGWADLLIIPCFLPRRCGCFRALCCSSLLCA